MAYGWYKVNILKIDLDTILVYITISICADGLEINMIAFYSIF